jgi:hypothetical protein
MTVKVTATDSGITAAMNDGRPAPLVWIEGWTFQIGGQLVTFQRSGDAGAATVMRIDSGGGHFVLRRESE